MPDVSTLVAFALVCLGMVLTPGPNMIYLVSRAISQGRTAAMISLGGVATGFMIYLLCAALGLTALLTGVPYAYDVLKIAGALYLLWLAWQAIRPGGSSPFQVRDLPVDSPRKLYLMGLMTNLLNPKAAVLYLSLLPQFIDPSRGSVFAQFMTLGLLQMCISITVNSVLAFTAGSVSQFLIRKPSFAVVQRWLMGTVLAGLAVRMAAEGHR